MAYKQIHEMFWTDPEIKKLDINDKLLFLYLISNPHANYCGLYYLPKSLIKEETGITDKGIDRGIDTLSVGYFIIYDDDLSMIWVRNMLKHQIGDKMVSEQQRTGIANQLKKLHNTVLIKDFLDCYGYLNINFTYTPHDTPIHTPMDIKKKKKDKKKDKEQKKPKSLTPLQLLWNQECTNLKKVIESSDNREERERLRLQERPLSVWKEVFVAINKSLFCRGENDRAWTADYDWIIKGKEYAIRALEGKYDDGNAVNWIDEL